MVSYLSASLQNYLKQFIFCEISLYFSSYNGQIIKSFGINSDQKFLNSLIELRECSFCANILLKVCLKFVFSAVRNLILMTRLLPIVKLYCTAVFRVLLPILLFGLLFGIKDGVHTFLRKVGGLLPNYMTLQIICFISYNFSKQEHHLFLLLYLNSMIYPYLCNPSHLVRILFLLFEFYSNPFFSSIILCHVRATEQLKRGLVFCALCPVVFSEPNKIDLSSL
jgi:hypothetical protein